MLMPVPLLGAAPPSDYADALVVESAAAYVPYANDVPLMVGVGVRLARVHELWVRAGYMPTGDDRRFGFGVLGYRAALRPGRFVRPVAGGFVSGLPETCGHDARGEPSCTRANLFIFSGVGGVRFEPAPWLGVSALLAAGMDTYPNPFGMIELGVSFAVPLS
jgi:hypothetical protein